MQISRFATLILAGSLALASQLLPAALADVTVNPAVLENKIKAYLEETTPLNDPEAELYVEIIKMPGHLTLRGEDVSISMEDNRTEAFTTRTIVQVTLSTEEESRQIGIPVRLAVEKPVWVSTKLIRARDPITSKDVTVQRKRMDFEAPFSLGAKERITAYTSRVNIAPGQIMDVRKLHLTPAVYRNDDVQLIISVGNGVNLKVYGKALEDGAIGKRIRVSREMPNHKTRVHVGEVINRNSVLVKM